MRARVCVFVCSAVLACDLRLKFYGPEESWHKKSCPQHFLPRRVILKKVVERRAKANPMQPNIEKSP